MEHISVNINGRTEAKEGETVILEGTIEFCPSIQYFKWQMRHDGKFIDVNIHKSKYKGTKNCLWNPTLVLNDLGLEDGGVYRIKVKSTTKDVNSNVHRIKILPQNETIHIYIQPDQRNCRYYVGEDVIINVRIRNVSKVLCKTWQKESETGSNIIDTSLEKIIETKNENGEYILTIRNCTESDSGTYFILAACINDMEVQSNKIQLNVVKESPEVITSYVPEAEYDTTVVYKATIRSFINDTLTMWKKGEKIIDTIKPKYKGSLNVGNYPVLCINNVSKKDEGVYSIHVRNKWGKTTFDYERLVVTGKEPVVSLKLSDQSQSVAHGNTITLQAKIKSYPAPSRIQWTRMRNVNKEEIIESKGRFSIDVSDLKCPKLTIEDLEFSDNGSYIITVTNDFGSVSAKIDIKTEASQMIFISGPVVVSSAGVIKFQTQFTAAQNYLNAKWLRCTMNKKKEISFKSTKYFIYNSSDEIQTQTFEIVDLKEDDSAGYQLSLDGLKSNQINTIVGDSKKYSTETQGNYFRYVALLSVCVDALRKAFDNLPDTFEEKINKFKRHCHRLQGNSKLKELLSRLNKNKPSSSKDLDVTLVCAIIRNLNYIAKPTNGWGKEPQKSDITMADDVERIRHYRNSLCHDTSTEMETDVFNNRALELIWAIRRLSMNDLKLTEDVCDAMNKIFTKGETMEKMIVELRTIKEKVIKWQYVWITGIIFSSTFINSVHKHWPSSNIDPVTSSNVAYLRQRTDACWGIMDYLHKPFTESVKLIKSLDRNKQIVPEIQNDTQSEILFHQVHDLGISLQNNCALATHRAWSDSGVCFTNRPLKVDEKVHMRGTHYCYGAEHHIFTKLGLTDINPSKIREAADKKAAIGSALTPVQCCDNPSKKHDHWLEDFHLCISLLPNACLAICLNDAAQKIYDCQIDSTYYPLWLVIELDDMASIWISHN